MTSSSTGNTKIVSITAEQELRLQCMRDVVVKLISGTADIFGWALPTDGRDITVPNGRAVAITTNTTATLRVTGSDFSSSVCTSFLHATYGAVLRDLDGMKQPRVLVCGQTDTGKSTICSILCNRGVRAGHGMVYVDGDLGQSSVTVPGTISAVLVDDYVHFTEGYNNAIPLSYYFGDTTLTYHTLPRYQGLCTELRRAVDSVCAHRTNVQYGGLVVNTMGWVTDAGYEAIKILIKAFDINVVFAIGDSRVEDSIKRDFATNIESGGIVLKSFPVAPGVLPREKAYRAAQRAGRVHAYFNGTTPGEYTPHRRKLTIRPAAYPDAKLTKDEVKVFFACPQMLSQMQAASVSPSVSPASAAGAAVLTDSPLTDAATPPTTTNTSTAANNSTSVGGGHAHATPVAPRDLKRLPTYLFAVVNAKSERHAALGANVAGFGAVAEVDPATGEMEVVLPNDLPLPSPYLIISRTVRVDPATMKIAGVDTSKNNNPPKRK
eukprot:PhM_4_TR5152/c0_g1_i3/m.23053/K14399/CLP1, HERB; polyribonucleotide 5'-hydroxyl-kinase